MARIPLETESEQEKWSNVQGNGLKLIARKTTKTFYFMRQRNNMKEIREMAGRPVVAASETANTNKAITQAIDDLKRDLRKTGTAADH
ncbi:hypothetical protein [Paracoccus ravus]|uniref:hypothetical protein n=1 Tax=Paracoccus ravus TaxID=2447760 RepID=UPI00106ED320|nr:hypothetical protein [Paracoccus ravus]